MVFGAFGMLVVLVRRYPSGFDVGFDGGFLVVQKYGESRCFDAFIRERRSEVRDGLCACLAGQMQQILYRCGPPESTVCTLYAVGINSCRSDVKKKFRRRLICAWANHRPTSTPAAAGWTKGGSRRGAEWSDLLVGQKVST